jgi:hypothetical protein
VRLVEEAQARQRAKENATKAWADPSVVGRACTSLGLCFKALANLSFMNDALAREVSGLLLTELSAHVPLRTRIPEQTPPKALAGHRVVLSDTNYKAALQQSVKLMSVEDKSIPFYLSFIDGWYSSSTSSHSEGVQAVAGNGSGTDRAREPASGRARTGADAGAGGGTARSRSAGPPPVNRPPLLTEEQGGKVKQRT